MVSAKKTKEAEKAVMLRASVEKTLAKREDCTAGAGGFLLLLGVGFTSECHFLYCVFDFHYFVFHSSKISISQIMRILNRKIHHICDIYAFFICRQRPHSVLDSLIQEVVWLNCYCWGNSSIPEGRFQSGSRVLKKVFWTLSYLYLWHTMWFHAKKLLRTLKFWKSLNSLCKSGSRPQKSPKKAQKTDHSIAIYSNFWIGMVYFGYHLVKAHVQTVQNMYGKGG